jgi:hypothetical protein
MHDDVIDGSKRQGLLQVSNADGAVLVIHAQQKQEVTNEVTG